MKATPISNTGDELPRGWIQTTLGEIAARVQYGTSAKTGSASDGVPVIRMGNIADGRLVIDKLKYLPADHKEFPDLLLAKGDVLFNRTNSAELVGKTTVYQGNPSPCSFASYLIRVRLNHGYRPELLAHYINSCFGRVWVASVVSQQVGQANVNGSKLQALGLPVPPLSEQHRIAAEIDKHFTRLDAAVVALKRIRANLQRYRASVLKAACEGRLVPTEAELARTEGRNFEPADMLLHRIIKQGRTKCEIQADAVSAERTNKAKYRERPAPNTASLRSLPEGWAWATMPQLGVLNRGKSKHRPRDDQRLFGGSYPFIQTGDVRRSGGLIREHSQTYNEFGLKQSRLWPAHTLCITIAANIAETGFLTYPACFPDSVVGFSSEGDPVTVRYIEKFLRTARQNLERFAPATAQKNINLKTLSGVNVPLPPLAEQHRIVAEADRRLSVVDELEASVEANLKRAERLRQSILKRAFEGKLVPQDPNDEPASVLLERIRAERNPKKTDAGSGERGSSDAGT